jgi:hypothetical protein
MDIKRLKIDPMNVQDAEAGDTDAKDAPESPADPPPPATGEGRSTAVSSPEATSALAVGHEEDADTQLAAAMLGIPPRLVLLLRAAIILLVAEGKQRCQRQPRSSADRSRSTLRRTFQRPNAWFPGPLTRTSAWRARSTWRPRLHRAR